MGQRLSQGRAGDSWQCGDSRGRKSVDLFSETEAPLGSEVSLNTNCSLYPGWEGAVAPVVLLHRGATALIILINPRFSSFCHPCELFFSLRKTQTTWRWPINRGELYWVYIPLYSCTVIYPILFWYRVTSMQYIATPSACISPCIVRILLVRSYWPGRLWKPYMMFFRIYMFFILFGIVFKFPTLLWKPFFDIFILARIIRFLQFLDDILQYWFRPVEIWQCRSRALFCRSKNFY